VTPRATLIGLALLAFCSPLAAREIHREQSLYQNILVIESDGLRCMQFSVRKDQRNQSCMELRRPQRLALVYSRMMLAGLLLDPAPQHILMVGLGGGSIPKALAALYPNASVDIVEIDPAVVEVARDYFDFRPTEQMHIYVQDARVWGKRAAFRARRYDLILLDAFNGDYIPEHLMTREYLSETRALLDDGGVLVSNTFAISALYHNESVTYADVFGTFFNFKSRDSANRIIIARRGALPVRASLDATARSLDAALTPLGVPIRRYPVRMSAEADWNLQARVLTDQYSPANLLKAER
jgi:spermidine synthase